MGEEILKRCCTCGLLKPLSEFWNYKKAKDGKQPRCKDCQREYKKTPEYKQAQAEYNQMYYQLPEVKEAVREWKKTPEQKAKTREYENRPEVRARRLQLSHTPERKEYQKRFREDPANHERVLEYRETFQEKYLMCAARKRSNMFGVPCTISEGDIQIPDVCPVLGVEIKRSRGRWTNNSPSLDRIVPRLGYVLGNIAVISMRANSLKRDGTAEEHRKIANWMLNHNPDEPMDKPGPGYVFGKTERALIYEATKRAKREDIPCVIRPENVFIPDLCPVLGIPMYPGKGKPHAGSPSLDKVVPKLGYTLENTRVISMRANLLKRDGTAEEHLKIADWMDSMLQSKVLDTNHEEEDPNGFE